MLELMPFQKRGVKKIVRFQGRALLADDMGLGKTIQALWYVRENVSGVTIVVCPAFLKWNWAAEAEKHFGVTALVLEGRKGVRRFPATKRKLVIVNPEILEAWLPYLKRLRPELVVLDECHYYKTRRTKKGGAKRTGYARDLCEDVPKVLALGGTPLESRPAELWPVLNILRPKLFPSFFAFATRYCQPRRRPWGWEYKGASKTEELHEILTSHVMIRRLKTDVLTDLPPKTRTVIPVAIQDRKIYEQAQNNFQAFVTQHASALGYGKSTSKQSGKLRAEALVQMGYLKHLAADCKVPAVMDWIDNFFESNPGEKLITFAIHKSVIGKLRDRYGKSCVVLDGSTPKEKRRPLVESFNERKGTRLLVGQMQACGTGWNGTVAQTVLMAELPWLPATCTQAEDRVHRIGQDYPTFCYYLVAKGTIEERLCGVLELKQAIIDAILDGRKVEDFSLLQKLLEGYINERSAA